MVDTRGLGAALRLRRVVMSTYICNDVAELQRRAFFEFVAIDCGNENNGADVWNVRGPGNYDRLAKGREEAESLVERLNAGLRKLVDLTGCDPRSVVARHVGDIVKIGVGDGGVGGGA